MTTLAPTYNFRGYPVRRLTYRGALAFVAREVGTAIGYPNGGKRFVSQITNEWKKEIREGEHWHRVSGSDLKALKAQGGAAAAAQDGPASGPSPLPVLANGPEAGPLSPGHGPRRGPSGAEDLDDGPAPGPSRAAAASAFLFAHESILLTEEGLNLALLRCGSTRPIAVEFRAWLARDVVPQIARTGKYDPAPAHLQLPRPSREIAALRRLVDHAILSGRLDVAAELLTTYRKLSVAPGVPLLLPPARLRASNRLLTRLIQRKALRGGPRLAPLFTQPAWRPSEKAVLALLLDLGAGERRVELSYRDVAERLDAHRSTVIDALNVLRKAGVVLGAGGRAGRDPVPNGYGIDLAALAAWNGKERPATWPWPWPKTEKELPR